jgi:hypothetical protein
VKKLISLAAMAAFVFAVGCNEPAKTTSKPVTPPTGSSVTTPPATTSKPVDKPTTKEDKKDDKKDDKKNGKD